MHNEAASVPGIDVTIDHAPRVNFAFQQNAIPIIHRIEIRNNTASDLHNVTCRFTPSPDFARDFEQRVALVPAESDYLLVDVPVDLNLDYLASLSDRVRGEIRVEVTAADDCDGEARSVFSKILPVEVYAYDEWIGLRSLPEILAAFVTPNVSVVDSLLSRVSDLLAETTDSSALNGYQSKSKKRVYEILDCTYRAVREQGIRYSNPPASFEESGQRVRFCEQIMQTKLATCLDLCLLFCAILEQAGLRPLVLMQKGHAYVGCWLVEESLPEPTCDDLQSIRKRVELEEILLFETTLVCDGNRCDFESAVAAARQHLRQDENFQDAIDVFRSRNVGIRPLPLKRAEAGVDLASAAEAGKPQAAPLPNRREERSFTDEIDFSNQLLTPEGRIDHWKQQLLDLTLRNRLLNFRETKQTIPLVCPDPEHLEDELSLEKTFSLKEQSKLMAGSDPRSLTLQERQFADDPLMTHLTEELRAKRLRSSLSETEHGRRLLELFRRTRMEMEESGANTLYLALGFLEWKETKDSDRVHRAPILLIPVTLDRKSVQQGFFLKRYDEDPMINVTLLEMLKRDCDLEIPGVNPPPEGEQGVDVGLVFRRFQQAVKDLQGWEVYRDVWLAQFSFNKFLLWKDLNDRVSTLTRNPVVDHLVNKPGQPFIDAIDEIREDELDDRVPYNEIFCPVSADSSQLAAILAASQGKNLVLHGPPGTGKSQTITNLIAHCLARGKRVLFVAEKRAALEVVHRRLSEIGLGPFCLELHSNKAGKADVLQQFGEALDFGSTRTSDEWEDLANKLETARNGLNVYVRELHRRYPNGLTAYHCYSWLIAHSTSGTPLPDLDPLRLDKIEEHSREDFEGLQQVCGDLRIRGSESRLSREATEALKPVGASSWTPEWEDQVIAAAKALEAKTDDFRQILDEIGESLNGDYKDVTRETLKALVELCERLVDAPVLPAEFVQAGDWASFREKAEEWISAGRCRDSARGTLKDFEVGAVLELDLVRLKEKCTILSEQAGLLNTIRRWFLLKPVRLARKKGTPKWKIDQASDFFSVADELVASHQKVAEAGEYATSRLGAIWAGGEADWAAIEQILAYGDDLDRLIGMVAGESAEKLQALRAKVGQLLAAAPDMLAADKSIGAKFNAFSAAWAELAAREDELKSLIHFNEAVPPKHAGHAPSLHELARILQLHRKNLQNWCRWQHSYQQAKAAQLGPLLDAVEAEALPLADLTAAFEKAYRENFLWRLLNLSETLRDFWGEEHQGRIEAFRSLDERFTEITAQAVVVRLANELPGARTEACPKNTELGILQRERVKKARHKPVRKLLNDIPAIAPKLKPCFLMSPLSVAQYLDAEQDNFDVVVFDEASQIPVWDAVGAIARGKQVVVVGDPKQLPPTNFFGRVDTDETAIDDGSIADLESILDECLGSGLPVYYLRWHYRSRREGLIAFSNQHYYENQLYTFPAPHSDVGVRLKPVPDGYYDKGKSRTNQAEAEAIRAEVLRRLTDPELAHQSIGIVTFSQAQQTLIMDMLDETRREHPEVEGHFGDDADEPLFVKNLENVQGDERDVILFSICYGPDAAGKLSMNFGPLNREGGERRLNVAITRAKHEILVFSTLRSEQIDLSRTRARGAEELKAYLEYAERGPRALATAVESAQQEQFDSIFESQVAGFLRARGFSLHTQVGCSGYRIDLAVMAPNAPGRYLLGIECDGASYHRAATARDRDRLRQAVLEGLGWRIHRIWSTDWWRNRQLAEEQLLVAVNQAVEEFGSATDAAGSKPDSLVANERYAEREEPPHQVKEPEGTAEETSPVRYAGNVPAAAPQSRAIDYPVVNLQRQEPQELFYEPQGRFVIERQIERIIAEEGPITEGLLLRRIAEEWRFNRLGSRIRGILTKHLPKTAAKTQQNGQSVYWPKDLYPDTYYCYRTPTEQEESKRKIEEIPAEEIKNAMLDILERYLSYPTEDLLREIAKCFGINRLTSRITQRLEEAAESLTQGGSVVGENGVMRLK